MADKSIYEIEYSQKVSDYMKEMKTVMVKGIGYIVIGKKCQLTPELLLNLAVSMEDRNLSC